MIMKKLMISAFFLLLAAGMYAQNLLPRQTIRGIIIDEQSNQPLSGKCVYQKWWV